MNISNSKVIILRYVFLLIHTKTWKKFHVSHVNEKKNMHIMIILDCTTINNQLFFHLNYASVGRQRVSMWAVSIIIIWCVVIYIQKFWTIFFLNNWKFINKKWQSEKFVSDGEDTLFFLLWNFILKNVKKRLTHVW